ncbi:unnamed protein product, partial [Scytosiphon promiscuus]
MKSLRTAHVIPKICEVRWATRRTSARDEGWKQATGATELKMSESARGRGTQRQRQQLADNGVDKE